MPATPHPDLAFAGLHDELLLEAAITLRSALEEIEEARGRQVDGEVATRRHAAIELTAATLEILQRAELAAVGVHESTRH